MKNNSDYWEKAFSKKIIKYKDSKKIDYILDNIEKTDKILEAGCGRGKINFKLADLGYNITGVDFSQGLIEQCVSFSKENEIAAITKFNVGDITCLPYKTSSFDVYMSFGVIEHFKKKDQEEIIKEAKRILKKGGRVVITVPNAYTPNVFSRFLIKIVKKMFFNESLVYQKNISTTKIKKMFGTHGFEMLSCYNFGLDKAAKRFFLLNYSKILGIPNVFAPFKWPIINSMKKLEPYLNKFGETTVYIGENRK
jgi:ubiquinone/menaquinone biosynthesis C-methylase UbiE